MYIVCLDLESILFPELWPAFAEEKKIDDLKRTTRDSCDVTELMRNRISVLASRGISFDEVIQSVAKTEPLPGAREFLDELRSFAQVAIVSDISIQFAMPLMEKLGYPSIFCNELVIGDDGIICDFRMRRENSKTSVIDAFHSAGYNIIAVGDSFNDIDMLKASEKGILFRSTDLIKRENPDLESCETYGRLLDIIKSIL